MDQIVGDDVAVHDSLDRLARHRDGAVLLVEAVVDAAEEERRVDVVLVAGAVQTFESGRLPLSAPL